MVTATDLFVGQVVSARGVGHCGLVFQNTEDERDAAARRPRFSGFSHEVGLSAQTLSVVQNIQ